MPGSRNLFPIALGMVVLCLLPAHGQIPTELQVTRPVGPMPSYEVATMKKTEEAPGPMMLGGPLRTTIRNYILNAYGMSSLQQMRAIGGPAWLDSDQYVIEAKPSDELRNAMQKMSREEQAQLNQMLKRSLLAERCKLTVHIEPREMPIFELVPAKSGLKIKEVPPFVPPAPGTPPSSFVPGAAVRPGMIMMQSKDGKTMLNARAVVMRQLINLLMVSTEVGGRSVLDKTGFAGSFDVTDLQWAGLASGMTGQAPAVPAGQVDAPSLFTALEESLGLKLQATKAMVEVVVIDSIERPSEN